MVARSPLPGAPPVPVASRAPQYNPAQSTNDPADKLRSALEESKVPGSLSASVKAMLKLLLLIGLIAERAAGQSVADAGHVSSSLPMIVIAPLSLALNRGAKVPVGADAAARAPAPAGAWSAAADIGIGSPIAAIASPATSTTKRDLRFNPGIPRPDFSQ